MLAGSCHKGTLSRERSITCNSTPPKKAPHVPRVLGAFAFLEQPKAVVTKLSIAIYQSLAAAFFQNCLFKA
jgi:hypothetical protein